MHLSSSGQTSAYPILFDKPSLSDTISKGRKRPSMALYGKVKPYPRHSHAVPTAGRFTAKPQEFCFSAQGQSIQFRRMSANRSHIFGSCRCGGLSAMLPVAVGGVSVPRLGGGLLGSFRCSAARFSKKIKIFLIFFNMLLNRFYCPF